MFGRLPDRDLVAAFADGVVSLLFPDGRDAPRTTAGIHAELEARCRTLVPVLAPLKDKLPASPEEIAHAFHVSLPAIHEQLTLDAEAIEAGDPAAHGTAEVVLAYPGFLALAFYRIAHALHGQGVPLVPRMISEIAHGRTGADIHPAARIGRSCCIDHGTGLVIGETAVIGDDVKLYQGVTLGALSVSKSASGTKRHPTIEDRVVMLRERDRAGRRHRRRLRLRHRRQRVAHPLGAPQLARLPPEPGPGPDRGRGRRSHRLRDLKGSVPVIFDNVLETIGNTPHVRHQPAVRPARLGVGQDRAPEPGRQHQGPHRPRDDRGRRGARRPRARTP